MLHLRFLRSSWFIWVGVLVLYALLILPTVGRQGISWDEQNDLWVAQAYLVPPAGLLVGSDVDPSQTRLPMAAVALFYRLLGVSDLITARLVSCLVGGLTLLAVYIYCRKRYQPRTGVLACLLLATSPFFLSFARVAFTETDIYLACAFAWLLVAIDDFQACPTPVRGAVVGVLLGLSLSAKFTAMAVLPAVWYAFFQSHVPALEKGLPQVKSSSLIFWGAWSFAFTFGGVILAYNLLAERGSGASQFALYIPVLIAWFIPLSWCLIHRAAVAPRLAQAFFITGLALLTFLILPPEHLTNPAILQSLLWRAQNELAINPGFLFEAAGLHIGSLIFKSGPLIGIGLFLSLLLTTAQWRNKPEARFPVLLVLFYFGGLLLLPLAQTFYIVPLLPILAIFAADQFLHLFSRRRVVAIGLACLAVILWGIDYDLSHPDYNLNGYQWLGKRVIFGRSSIGYRSIVQTPSDGVEQVIQYINEKAQPGDRVRSYLLEWHIIQAVASNPAYRIEDGFLAPYPNAEYGGVEIYRYFVDNSPFAPPRPDPDFVVVEINTQVRQSWWANVSKGDVFQPPYNPAWLTKNYNRVFTVRRAFGIEMASVWKKK